MAKKIDLSEKPNNEISRVNKNTRPIDYNEDELANDSVDESAENIPDETIQPEEPQNTSGGFRRGLLAGLRGNPKAAAVSALKEFNENTTTGEKAKILMKNPVTRRIILILIPIVIGLLFIVYIIMVISGAEEYANGVNGYYEYYDGACKEVLLSSGNKIGIEEYTAGILSQEDNGYSEETLKTLAVAIRTHIVSKATKIGDNSTDCYYELPQSDSVFQKYTSTNQEKYTTAVSETKGLIITTNNTIVNGYYDDSCVYTASQAGEIDLTKTYSDDSYYIMYGKNEIDGINFQEISKTDIPNIKGTLNTYVNYALNGQACYNNNGYGISKNGTEYLSTIYGYNWQKIVSYYYNNSIKIMSIFRAVNQEGTIYKQWDPAWRNIPLGSSSATMGNAGCAVTSIAIGISFSGTPVTTSTFDAGVFINALNAGGCFTSRGWINWSCGAITRVAPAVKLVTARGLGGTNENKIQVINSYPLDRYIVITHFKNYAHSSHYVNFQEFVNTNEYLARDPGAGKLTTQNISEIDQLIVYSY